MGGKSHKSPSAISRATFLIGDGLVEFKSRPVVRLQITACLSEMKTCHSFDFIAERIFNVHVLTVLCETKTLYRIRDIFGQSTKRES